MPYPLDDNGNIRVDFVWGNVPMQPDEQRTDDGADWNDNYNQPGDRGWTAPSQGATSDTLNTTYIQELSVGDQSTLNAAWDDVDVRAVVVPTIHDIATTGYNNYPAFTPNYDGDGDTNFDFPIPDVRGLTRAAARAAIEVLGLNFSDSWTYVGATVANDNTVKSQDQAPGSYLSVGDSVTAAYYRAPEVPLFIGLTNTAGTFENSGVVLGTVTTSTDGATELNNGQVKSQSPAFGTKVNAGSAVNLVTYNYVAPIVSTTGPIAGFNRNSAGTSFTALNGDDAIMYLVGRTVRPAVGDVITVAESSQTQFNRNWTVAAIENNDSYNTGGTAVKITVASGDTFTGTTASGGTWTKI